MEGEPEEGSFEGLMEAGHEAVDDHFDPNTITHAMITPDGTTVPITLNPETGKHKEAFSTLFDSLVQMTCIDFTIPSYSSLAMENSGKCITYADNR